MARRYRAFISYSWADKEWGEWVHHALETYRTPHALVGSDGALGPIPERLHPIFKDREEEAAGHGITAAIETALADSEFLIVVCSPNSAKSKWVNREIAWFKTHRDKTRILALVVAGEPLASFNGDAANECFPKALLYEVGDDLLPTDKAEDPPLAADARKAGDGKRGARLKLAAALLGAGLDATPAGAATAAVNVLVIDAGGVYRVSCSGAYVRPNCDLDFSGASLNGRAVKIVFLIASGSTKGVGFAGAGEDNMWIVERALAGPTGEPTGRYQGDQFTDFKVAGGGRRLEVTNKNDDAKVYQYALRFTVPTVIGKADAAGSERLANLDEESAEDAYQYAVAVDGPGGRLIIDPKVKNGSENR